MIRIGIAVCTLTIMISFDASTFTKLNHLKLRIPRSYFVYNQGLSFITDLHHCRDSIIDPAD